MPIQLTKSFDPGDIDPEVAYAQVKIVSYIVDIISRTLRMNCEYGNTVTGVWTPGKVPITAIELNSAAFLPLMLQAVVQGETVYNAVSRVLYQHLIDEEIYPGTIV